MDNSIHPPSTGWKFDNNQNFVGWQFDNKFDKRRDFDEVIKMGHFQEDPSVTCSIPPASSPCSVTLRLIGLAKDFQGKCEGEYKDTGLRSKGRQVTLSSWPACSFQTIDRCSNWRALLSDTSL